jgi:hypothetical protein
METNVFNCSKCSKPIGPGISPFKLVDRVREVNYTNINIEGETFVTRGTEIVSESKICPTCYGVPKVESQSEEDLSGILAGVKSATIHARKCNKSPFDCKICLSGMKFYGELPPATLSRVL